MSEGGGSQTERATPELSALRAYKKAVDIAFTAGMLGMSGEVGFKIPCHEFVTSMKVAFRQAESEYMKSFGATHPTEHAGPTQTERATPTDEEVILQERDEAEEWADKLAYAIGEHFGVSVGEHSSCNDPRAEALKILNGEYVTLDSLRDALYVHWLSEMVCNHEAKTDVSRCACGQFESKPQPNVGEAVKRWIEHVYRSVGFDPTEHAGPTQTERERFDALAREAIAATLMSDRLAHEVLADHFEKCWQAAWAELTELQTDAFECQRQEIESLRATRSAQPAQPHSEYLAGMEEAAKIADGAKGEFDRQKSDDAWELGWTFGAGATSERIRKRAKELEAGAQPAQPEPKEKS